jgi:UDP-N-acetylmuramoylalanine--D-glutamate ligase
LAKAVGLNSKEIASGVKSFAALHHRCEPIVQNQNMLIVNDSKSTNWDSTITALQAMQGRGAITLVIGGKLRGRNDEPTPDIVQQIYVLAQKIILFGEASTILQPFFKSAEVLKKIDDLRNTFLPDFKKGVLLFSPAFPSFDVYKNYEERGDHFRKVISDYFSSR